MTSPVIEWRRRELANLHSRRTALVEKRTLTQAEDSHFRVSLGRMIASAERDVVAAVADESRWSQERAGFDLAEDRRSEAIELECFCSPRGYA